MKKNRKHQKRSVKRVITAKRHSSSKMIKKLFHHAQEHTTGFVATVQELDQELHDINKEEEKECLMPGSKTMEQDLFANACMFWEHFVGLIKIKQFFAALKYFLYAEEKCLLRSYVKDPIHRFKVYSEIIKPLMELQLPHGVAEEAYQLCLEREARLNANSLVGRRAFEDMAEVLKIVIFWLVPGMNPLCKEDVDARTCIMEIVQRKKENRKEAIKKKSFIERIFRC